LHRLGKFLNSRRVSAKLLIELYDQSIHTLQPLWVDDSSNVVIQGLCIEFIELFFDKSLVACSEFVVVVWQELVRALEVFEAYW
jgi:hypothetical protein